MSDQAKAIEREEAETAAEIARTNQERFSVECACESSVTPANGHGSFCADCGETLS